MNDIFSDFPDFIRKGSPEFLLHFIRLTGGDQQACALVSSDLRTLAYTSAASQILGRKTFQSLWDILSSHTCHMALACLESHCSLYLQESIDGLPYFITFYPLYPLEDSLLLLLRPVEPETEPDFYEIFYQNQIHENLANIQHVCQRIPSVSDEPESLKKYTEMIRKNALRIVRAQNHLHFLSPTFTREQLRMSTEDLAEMVQKIGEHGAKALEKQGRQLILERPDCLFSVLDPEAINIAIYNLLINSVHYTQGNIRLTLRQTNSKAILSISDEGDGIPENIMMDIQSASTKKGFSLTSCGLGIALARKIAMLHDGNLMFAQTNTGFSAILTISLMLPSQGFQQFSSYVSSSYQTEDVEFFSLL